MSAKITEESILELARGFMASRVILSGIDLDVFSHIGDGASAADVAEARGIALENSAKRGRHRDTPAGVDVAFEGRDKAVHPRSLCFSSTQDIARRLTLTTRTGPGAHLEAPLRQPVPPVQPKIIPTHQQAAGLKRGAAVARPGPHQPGATATPLSPRRNGPLWDNMGFSGRQWILMGISRQKPGNNKLSTGSRAVRNPKAAGQRAGYGFRASRREGVFASMFRERVAWGVECDDPATTIQAAMILPGRHGSMMGSMMGSMTGSIMGIAWAMPPASARVTPIGKR